MGFKIAGFTIGATLGICLTIFGIALTSHPRAVKASSKLPQGVFKFYDTDTGFICYLYYDHGISCVNGGK